MRWPLLRVIWGTLYPFILGRLLVLQGREKPIRAAGYNGPNNPDIRALSYISRHAGRVCRQPPDVLVWLFSLLVAELAVSR
jgi:hypothetical protein